MPKFVRVRDTETGHKFSTANPNQPHLEVLEDRAVSKSGRALNPEAKRPNRLPAPNLNGANWGNLNGANDDDKGDDE